MGGRFFIVKPFFQQMRKAMAAAQSTFGETFFINGDQVNTFTGIFTRLDSHDVLDVGEFSGEVSAVIETDRDQFETLGLTPSVGDVVNIISTDYRVLRVNPDEVSFELLLREADR